MSNWQREHLEQRDLRERLVRAATEEHRLHLRAAAERQSEHRWRERADLARVRGLADLTTEALERAETHQQRASHLDAAFRRQRAVVEQLRQAVRYPGLVRARTVVAQPLQSEPDATEQRLTQLERESCLERDLDELRLRRATTRNQSEPIKTRPGQNPANLAVT